MVYLVNKESNQIVNMYGNVVLWNRLYVVCKDTQEKPQIIYAKKDEYFTDKNPNVKTQEVQKNLNRPHMSKEDRRALMRALRLRNRSKKEN